MYRVSKAHPLKDDKAPAKAKRSLKSQAHSAAIVVPAVWHEALSLRVCIKKPLLV
jgi:hypothetical protein